MKPAIKIQIPEPCRQAWDEMMPENGGRHCISCAKTVVDFTRMSDAQILEVLRKSAVGCGRFRPDQLNRHLMAPYAQKRFSFIPFYRIVASLLLNLFAGEASSTENPLFTQESVPNADPWSSRVEGIVNDAKGKPLTGVIIKITETTSGALINGALTDEDGSYRIIILGKTAVENVQLSFSCNDYVTNIVEKVILAEEQTTIVNTVLMPFSKQDSLLLRQGGVPATTHVYSKPLIEVFDPHLSTLTAKQIEWKMGIIDLSQQVCIPAGVLHTENQVRLLPKPRKWWQFWKRH